MFSVPLAMASPVLGEIPATASHSSEVSKTSDSESLVAPSSAQEITGVIPELPPSKPVSSYRVKSGDTVTQIAKRFGVSVSKIASLNNLGPTSLIKVGQTLKLTGSPDKKPVVESYRVKAGDTLSAIAKKHGLSLQELTAVNRIFASTIIYPGQVLKVAKIITAPTPAPNEPNSYQVRAGDSLESIAKRFSLTITALRDNNGLSKSSIIYVGQVLALSPQKKPLSPGAKLQGPPQSSPAVSNAGAIGNTPTQENSRVGTMRPSRACTIHGFHKVLAGETVSRIAAVYGVSTQSVLSSNSLSWSSTIYVGQQLIIPGVHQIQHCPSITVLTAEMRTNAEHIHRVGISLGVGSFGIAIALATAMQESSLRNINFGDRDSVGLFQQRPSAGWGSVEQIMNPEYSARAFFGGPKGPNFGKVRGLLDIRNWSSMKLSEAAQAVQMSAFPDAYQKWELSAWSWIGQIESVKDD